MMIKMIYELCWMTYIYVKWRLSTELVNKEKTGGLEALAFNVTFNNISVILWQSFLLLKETGVSRENNQPASSHWQTLSHNVVSSTSCPSGIQSHNVSGYLGRLADTNKDSNIKI